MKFRSHTLLGAVLAIATLALICAATEDVATDDVATKNASTEDVANEDAATEDASSEDAVTKDELSTSKKVLDTRPIVIHTVAQSYDKPTLSDYQECHANRDSCLLVCESAAQRSACEAQCPACPLLVEEQLVVQGINDTDYRVADPAATAVNTTNIVRLTNEIRNIIDNKMGDITTRNENNVQVHQNISRSGGRFGLGQDASGAPCCLVKRAPKGCRQGSREPRCRRHKTQRQCGERCQARVMYAKPVLRCRSTGEDDTDMEAERSCSLSFSYVPHRPQRNPKPRCHHTSSWPFVQCGRSNSHGNCRRCMQLPYAYILQRGMPPHCGRCFGYAQPTVWYAPPPLYGGGAGGYPGWPSYGGGGSSDWADDELPPLGADDGDWEVEQSKCRRTDGTLMSNCHDEAALDDETLGRGSQDDFVGGGEYYGSEDDDDDDVYDSYDAIDGEERDVPDLYTHKTFRRSAYSRRHRVK